MNLSERIKSHYEDRYKTKLMRGAITFLRLDGKSFSKFTKALNKPFDEGFSEDMDMTAKFLCENIQGAKFAYTQSDEITVVLTDYDTIDTQAWFDYEVNKMVSISASLATGRFNQLRMYRYFAGPKNNIVTENDKTIGEHFRVNVNLEGVTDDIASFVNYLPLNDKLGFFDSRVFQVPNVEEMINVLVWRQQDCSRNSVSMAATEYLGHKATEGKSGAEKQEMLFQQKGINWNDYKTKFKRGSVIRKIQVEEKGTIRSRWIVDEDTPIFTADKEYLRQLVPKIM
jgi:tRNA(His) 5'-end guanylyltransferase